MKPILGATYTCPNSSMIVEIAKIRYRGDGYTKVWLRYFTKSGIFLTEERNVKLVHERIKHWERVI